MFFFASKKLSENYFWTRAVGTEVKEENPPPMSSCLYVNSLLPLQDLFVAI